MQPGAVRAQVPCAVVEVTQAEPVPGFFVVMCTVILWMKLVSYAHCNHDFRSAPAACARAPSTRPHPSLVRQRRPWGRSPCWHVFTEPHSPCCSQAGRADAAMHRVITRSALRRQCV